MTFARILSISMYNSIVFLFLFFFPAIFLMSHPLLLGLFFSCYILLGVRPFYRKIFNNYSNISDEFSDEAQAAKLITSYVINLDRAIDRLNFVMPQITALQFPYEIISAIDGQFITDEEKETLVDIESYTKFFKMLPENGTIGCSLSHEKAWRAFMNSSSEFALILEDDVVFDAERVSSVVKKLIEVPEIWDVVSFELNHYGNPMRIADIEEGVQLSAYMTNVKHAGCYLINRIAARKMLEKFYPIKMPIDHYFSSPWEFDLKFAGIEPRLVEQCGLKSQIKISEKKVIKDKMLLIANAYHLAQISIIHLIYNFVYFMLYRQATAEVDAPIDLNNNGKVIYVLKEYFNKLKNITCDLFIKIKDIVEKGIFKK